VAVETAVYSWADPAPLVDRGPWRLVLASDVLYGQRNVDELLALLPRLVDDDGEAWITDPKRPLTDEFLEAATAAWRSVESTPSRLPQIHIIRLSGRRRPG
jgi:predicted nicotinamide N-methyase